jgi:hypothetical protein
MKERKEIYAEDLNCWQTSAAGPDKWIDKAISQVETLGGHVKQHGFGSESGGREAYMLGFEIEGDLFRIVWPVMRSRGGNQRAARVQAATTLYHYIKGVCLSALVLGPRVAFFSHFLLSDGRTASEVAEPELLKGMPKMLKGRD